MCCPGWHFPAILPLKSFVTSFKSALRALHFCYPCSERYYCIRKLPQKRMNFENSINSRRSCWVPEGEAAGKADVSQRSLPLQGLAGEWRVETSCRSLLPLFFSGSAPQLRSSLPQKWLFGPVPAFLTPAGLSFKKEKKKNNNQPTHTTVYPGLPSVPLACWCHRVAPCSTCISNAFSFSAEIVKVVLSDTSLLLPGTNQNPRALSISACPTLANNFF